MNPTSLFHLLLLLLLSTATAFTPKANTSGSVLDYRNQKINNTLPKPLVLFSQASPMSSDTVAIFAQFMGEGSISDHLLSFCKEAQMACFLSSSSDATNSFMINYTDIATDSFMINYVDIATDSFMINYHVDSATDSFMIGYANSATGSHLDSGKEPSKFLREPTLKSENVMPIPDITNKMPKRSFLPRRISSKLPFSTLKLPQLNQIFRAKENSPMGKILARTIALCESAVIYGEKKSCVSSIEDTIDFATAILGHDVMVLSTTSTGGSKQQVMVGHVKRMESSDTRKSVVCHQILFPSQLRGANQSVFS
ncbi:polygalacturonase 1 beta-like protein 1 [Syzygium oleosum]|uniref:polygalacturonase 1 beta-like protein 1 n=1 Tax=Syzygium oleosum TaxID=219896 RepID=UPI0024BB4BD9|nr:polygalacturonase 1 beta-like protein 1 [Syzygium oleosum]